MRKTLWRPRRLTTKFMLGLGIILFCAVSIASLLFYDHLKDLYIQETYQKTDIVLGHIDATMEYVRDELRPQMYHVLPKDEFIREAMSTSFVNKGIMKRFAARFPDYIYRRVAVDPINPANRADRLEERFIGEFAKRPGAKNEWEGLITRNGKQYFAHFKAVRMEEQCVTCHGDPSHSPQSLIQRYGKNHGHSWKVGDIAGLESVAIPVDETFYRLRQIAFSLFLLGLTGMAVLFLVLNYFYYTIAAKPLQRASSFFQSIASGGKGLDVRFDAKGHDEISALAESFNRMIDHLKESQDNLAVSELKYRRIFEGSKDAIILADCPGFIVDINNAGVELLGRRNKADLVGDVSLHDFFADEKAPDELFGRLEKDGFIKDYETVFRKEDGDETHILISATYRKDKNNDVCGYECIIKDITERKRMEERIRHADKLASVGQLAAGVAHEINNPLSLILGYSRLLMKEVPEERLKEDLSVIRNNAQLCKKIIEDLLSFSRQTKGHYSEEDINATIESVVTAVESRFSGEGIRIARDYDASLPRVAVDADKIRQVSMNLLMNAYQAMDFAGLISVSTRYDDVRKGVTITFSDTGRGIPVDIQGRIFEPFFTTKEPGEGTGLGLAVTYGIIREHKGEITVESEQGRGTTFHVWLPVEGGRA
ncbi:MAG: DUF3365 domain-containing protein [Nitrospirae bacterium]|nr:DUF3365 domain-containing protein [Nitrospirota bacterium]